MKGRPTWDTYEAWLTGFLDTPDADLLDAPLAMIFTGGQADWLIDSRHERPDDEVDPLTELAVVVGELAPDAAVVAAPVRIRDLHEADAPVVSRTWVVTSYARRADGEGYDLRTRTLPVDGIGSASDLDVEHGPVASVLDDAIRNRLGVAPVHALYTAVSWGHQLMVDGSGEVDLDLSAGAPAESSAGGGTREAEAARHRLSRHARDLAARHQPTAGWPQPLHRPAVHASTPDGWQAACPI